MHMSSSASLFVCSSSNLSKARMRGSWRLYTEFADRACFLDIETTGLSADYDKVTTIGAWGGGKLALFVQSVNLDQFPTYIPQFPLLVTFNGSQS